MWTVATWNVNSVRMRLERLKAWLAARQPDVVALQETKVCDEDFPAAEIEALGYHVSCCGQRTYNGVAILSKRPIEACVRGFSDGGEDDERRLLAAVVDGVRIVDVYVPNGQAVDSPKFPYKLEWFHRLRAFLESWGSPTDPLLVLGDFNVAPEDRDVHDPDLWRGQIHFHPKEHEALAHLRGFGLHDLLRDHRPEGGLYTWWDYRMLAFPKNRGLRIDLILGTQAIRDRCRGVEIDRNERKGEKPSDHVPVVALFG
jgi:exodeoxyribonuclease-3